MRWWKCDMFRETIMFAMAKWFGVVILALGPPISRTAAKFKSAQLDFR